jgi:hypothetical protein
MGIIIAIAGESEAGKDEIGRIIDKLWLSKSYKGSKATGRMNARWTDEFDTIKFADGINRTIAGLTGLPLDYVTNKDNYLKPIKWLNDKTLRDLKQVIGEGLKPLLGQDVWVKSAFTKKSGTKNIKVTDIRFPIELDFLWNIKEEKKQTVILLFVIRPEHKSSTLNESNKDAISEKIVSTLDKSKFHVIINDGTVEQLEKKVEQVLETYDVWKYPFSPKDF